jgi:exopolysaccharide production protein ExoZ
MPATRNYYPGLDVVRFAAAMLVALYHLAWRPWAAGYIGPLLLLPAMPTREAPMFGVPFGWVGVQVFFVLSGVVIANSASNIAPSKFLRHRIYRLYPVAIISAIVAALIFLAFGQRGIFLPFLRSLVLWPIGPWLSGVYWTLPVEIVFYGLVYIWIRFLPRTSLAILAAALTLWSATFYLLNYLHVGPHSDTLSTLFLFRYGAFFAVGILLFDLTRTRSAWRCIVLAVALGICTFSIESLPENRANPGAAATFIISSAIISASLFAPLLRQAKVSGARALGLMTYPMYLLHFVVGTAVEAIMFRYGAGASEAAAVAILAILASSYIIVRLPERIVRNWFKSLLEPAKTPTSA